MSTTKKEGGPLRERAPFAQETHRKKPPESTSAASEADLQGTRRKEGREERGTDADLAPVCVAGYVRTSTKKQDLESQAAAVTGWAERAGHTLVMHEDDATTGRKVDREGIEGLLAAAERREFTLVAVTELSRIGRSIGFIHKTVERLSELGIKVVLVNTGTILDYATLEGRALIGALALAADVEWMLIRERNERGRATIKSRNVKVGRKPVTLSEAVLRALRDRRMSVREIALEVNASPATVGRRLKALGLGDPPA